MSTPSSAPLVASGASSSRVSSVSSLPTFHPLLLWCPELRVDIPICCKLCETESMAKQAARGRSRRKYYTVELVRCHACQYVFDASKGILKRKWQAEHAEQQRIDRKKRSLSNDVEDTSVASSEPSPTGARGRVIMSTRRMSAWPTSKDGASPAAMPYVDWHGRVRTPPSPPFSDTFIDS